jgi:ceramide glucosyltransferase
VSSRQDPAYTIIRQVLNDHPSHDARLLVEDEDEKLLAGELGPNPKIRNMSRAYREAKGDAIWIIDCNVWVNPGACARMVDNLYGYTHAERQRPYKLVHHLPVAIDAPSTTISPGSPGKAQIANGHVPHAAVASHSHIRPPFGGRLEELFLSSSHAKFYTAINTVSIAPCIVGKSTMFRRSHLDSLTKGQGIDFFSHNICEDHLIGDLLWKSKLPSETDADGKALKLRNHGIVFGDIAVQPVADMSVCAYVARRVRWLRVRKFTVPAATLVEPGTESLAASTMGVWGLSRSVIAREWLSRMPGLHLGEVGSSQEMLLLFATSILVWCTVDWTVYLLLHSGATIEAKEANALSKKASVAPSDKAGPNSRAVPPFLLPSTQSSPQAHSVLSTLLNTIAIPLTTIFALLSSIRNLRPRRPFSTWLRAWIGRELLALPIWLWAIWGGVTVEWRGRKLWVGWDMKVHEVVNKHDGHGKME